MGEREIPGVFGADDDEARRAHQAALAGGDQDPAGSAELKVAKAGPGFGTIFGAVLLALFVDSCAGALIFSAL